MKQKFTALAIIIICLAIFAAVIISITYHMPLQIVSSIEMLSDENERYAVEINLYINRFFFSPDKVTGRIFVNDICYETAQNHELITANRKQRYQLKKQGYIYVPHLINIDGNQYDYIDIDEIIYNDKNEIECLVFDFRNTKLQFQK